MTDPTTDLPTTDLPTTDRPTTGAPIVVTASFEPLPGKYDEVVAALQPAIAAVHTEAGCLLYTIHAGPDDQILMIEKWASVGALDLHGSGPAVRALGASLDGLLVRPTTVTRLQPIPAGTPEQGLL